MVPSGTVTFLFTDIEGSTRRWEQYPAGMRDAVGRHDVLMRRAVTEAGGHVFKTVGDAFCAVFTTPHAAVSAALNAQRALLQEDWAAVDGLSVRMSLHSGVADERDNDYFGPAVNRVARLLGAAHGGQVLMSGVTQALVSDALPAGVSLRDLGSHRLKDLGRSEQVFQLLHDDLPSDFPDILSLASFPNNLPLQLSSFVGREKELARVKELLSAARLLTLTGFGGSGKTRLGLQAALERLEQYPEGVWWVGLAPISDPSQVAQTIAGELGLREERGRRVEETLVDYLRPRRLLLLLDNCEHLLAACRALCVAILQAAPNVQILATSREGLGIPGEMVWPVPPLSLPSGRDPHAAADLAALANSEAVRLFLDRAMAVKPDFAISETNAGAIIDICRRLDANPLAIELAATRASAMTPQQIAERLKQRFRLLTGGNRTALPQQQTLRAALDWSHDLLEAREKRLFHRLSIFAGGWTLDAAEALCVDQEDESPEGGLIEDWDVVDLAGQLIAKSLVNVDDEAGMREWLQQTIREYAAEQLEAAGRRERQALLHARHFQALAERLEAELAGPGMGAAMVQLDQERANLLSALNWASGEGGDPLLALRLGGALWRYWYLRGSPAEGREALERALSAARAAGLPDGPELAKALHGAGTLATFQGDFAAAEGWLEGAVALWRGLGDEAAAYRSLNNLAILSHEAGDYLAAQRLFSECLEAMRETGDQLSLARGHVNVATVALELGDFAAARAGFEASLAIQRRLNNPPGIAQALRQLGATAVDQGDSATALPLVEASIAISRQLGDNPGIAECLNHLCQIAYHEGDLDLARERAAEWLALERQIGNQRSIALALGVQGAIAFDAGDDATAEAALGQSLQILERIGHRRGQASSLNHLGRLALRRGDAAAARQHLRRALALQEAMGSPLHLLDALDAVATLGLAVEQAGTALQLAAAAASLRTRLGMRPGEARRRAHEALVAAAAARAGADVSAVTAQVQHLTLEDLVRLAQALLAEG